MQIELTFTAKVLLVASFWKWDFLELGYGLPYTKYGMYVHVYFLFNLF